MIIIYFPIGTRNGDSDFSILTTRPGEAIKMASAYMILGMEVMASLNEAVLACGSDGAVHYVDEAVAYYAGSLSSQPDTREGILYFALAEIRAHQSRTAGHTGVEDTGDAFVNIAIMELFTQMQGFVSAGTPDQCVQAEESRLLIISLMKIPLLQSVLRNAHTLQHEFPEMLEDEEQIRAEGAAFAAAVLPFIHDCDPSDALIVHENMRVESNNTAFSFVAVREALERQYACLGVSCERVGGIWDGADWKPDGRPCPAYFAGNSSSLSPSDSTSTSRTQRLLSTRTFTVGAMLCLCLNSFGL